MFDLVDAMTYYIGVDVGTSSVRAGLFSENGRMVTLATNPIHILETEPGFYEQSTDNIWQACCTCVRVCINNSII